MIPAASGLVHFGILGLSLLVSALFAWAVWASGRGRAADAGERRVTRTALALAGAWLGGTGLSAATGMLADFDARPPPYLFLMLGTIGLAIFAGASRLGKRLSEELPLVALVGAQAFRLPLELVMHQAGVEGVMPVQLSYGGFNFDILTGGSAILLAVLLYFKRAPLGILAAWNALGLACLLVIAVIALLTSPVLRVFGDGSVNYWVAYFPFVWLPAACVVFALASHIVILRRLRSELGGATRRVGA